MLKGKIVSLIIPVFNEETRISKSLDIVKDYFLQKGYDHEIVVVDDGSTDGTVDVLSKYINDITLVRLAKNQGKGAAVRAGMLSAQGDYKIFSDADLSIPIYEIEKLLEKLESGADICIGSRAINPELIKLHQPFYREFMGKTFNKLVQFIVMKGIKDTQCGFKGFTSEAAEKVFSRSKINGFSFDVEILYLASKSGLKIEEVPVEWYHDPRTKVNLFWDSLQMLIELFKIRRIHSNTDFHN
jgi:dolichyl-phosphate beta-glucosyltransferase